MAIIAITIALPKVQSGNNMLHSFQKDRLYGFKNEQGTIVIQPGFEEVEEFRDHVATVKTGDRWGLINENGDTLIPFEYSSIYAYKKWVQAEKADSHFLFTTAGEKVLEIADIRAWHYPEEELIRVKRKTGWGCIDMEGRPVIPFRYISLGPCKNGWLSFFENGHWGWLNKEGKMLVPAVYKEAGHWNKKYWWSRDEEGYRLWEYNRTPAHSEVWMKILLPENETGAVKTKQGWKYIDADLNTVLQLSPGYEWVEHFSEQRAAVKKGGKWGFIDLCGKEVIRPEYRNVLAFGEGLAAVQKEGLWGFIDTGGALVIPCMHKAAGPFKNGKARVSDHWYEWYIDRHGKEVSERKYIG